MADTKDKNIETNSAEEIKADEIKGADDADIAQKLAELTAQNQTLMNEVAKLKKASDKNASEAAEFKKKYRETLSAQEQASEEKAEAEAEREEQFKKLLRENQIAKYVRQYMKQGYKEELAQKAAEAMYDGDTDALFNAQTEATGEIIKAKEREWLKSRPDVNAGTGTQGVTKEQFDSMNMMQRSELRRKSPEVYERLVGRS
ncbi:MAG: hypothetical protein IKO36_08285 [Bacteroidaceae bacterium]|nr:hypothetical protein [Bacteroidaceae bacterium]